MYIGLVTELLEASSRWSIDSSDYPERYNNRLVSLVSKWKTRYELYIRGFKGSLGGLFCVLYKTASCYRDGRCVPVLGAPNVKSSSHSEASLRLSLRGLVKRPRCYKMSAPKERLTQIVPSRTGRSRDRYRERCYLFSDPGWVIRRMQQTPR